MEVIPAIDVLEGSVVRLTKGLYDTATVYTRDPIAVVRQFEDEGASLIHVVDLDGARDGVPGNLALIERIVEESDLPVQVGGGIRTAESARRWLDAGAKRVVIGTAAIKAPAIVESLCRAEPGSIVIALDCHDDKIATDGWQETSDETVLEVAPRVEGWGATAILYTNIARDGTREGPDVAGTLRVQNAVEIPVIASGGIGDLADVESLRAAGIRAAICGRALYSGAFTLGDALAVARK